MNFLHDTRFIETVPNRKDIKKIDSLKLLKLKFEYIVHNEGLWEGKRSNREVSSQRIKENSLFQSALRERELFQ